MLWLMLWGVLFAQSETGAVTRATAGAGRAALEGSDSPKLNPASLVFLRGYLFTAISTQSAESFNSDLGAQKRPSKHFGLRLTDRLNSTSTPASFSYDQTRVETNGDFPAPPIENSQDFQLGFASFVSSRVSLGMGFRYRDVLARDVRQTQWNAILGSIWAPTPDLSFSYTLENPTALHSSKLPAEARLRPQSAFGFNFNATPTLRLKADVLSDESHSWSKPTAAVGFESYMNKWLVLRFGIGRDFFHEQIRTGMGLGFVGPRFSLQYGQSNLAASPQSVSPTIARNAQVEHTIDLLVAVW